MRVRGMEQRVHLVADFVHLKIKSGQEPELRQKPRESSLLADRFYRIFGGTIFSLPCWTLGNRRYLNVFLAEVSNCNRWFGTK